MKRFTRFFLAALSAVLLSYGARADETNAAADQAEAGYNKAIEGRTADILKVLDLTNADTQTKVHDIIIAQYRGLKAWHEDNDARLKASKSDTNTTAQIRASLKTIHDDFLGKLAQNLTPDQIDQVKDKMTYGKVQFTFKGYVSQYPDLTEENKQRILGFLKEAREEAMDGGSAAEKTAVFQRYKGRINNYLSKQGLHPGKPKPDAATNNG
jgi:hypothetical protein